MFLSLFKACLFMVSDYFDYLGSESKSPRKYLLNKLGKTSVDILG